MRKWERVADKRWQMLEARRNEYRYDWSMTTQSPYVTKRCRNTMRPVAKCNCKDCVVDRVYDALGGE